ncbi:ABC transporter permease [Tabrizicola fusiformis]|uniref:ABC transporter permease n=1 Tax=Tabrizicola sp. SY72 TaxID=2741673 RepID=UPI001574D5D4|nr:ABC transporter permease subunit [Tabrizicola sp. SY72]NTT84376.1 ABC transporter permease subunit [Tabrizicola sp. SY72]
MTVFLNSARPLRVSPGLALWIVAGFLFLGLFGPWLVPHDPLKQNLLAAGQGPGLVHWLGTDHLGRDTFSRLIAAANTSLVGITLVLGIALIIGIGLGTLAGYRRGWTEEAIMRVTDVGLAMPSLIIALAMIGIFGTGYWNMVIALALAWWPSFCRVSRAVVVGVMNKPHIEALRVMGASPLRIFFVHLLPTTTGSVLVYATADAGGLALSIATLSFLGLGIQPPTPEWGQMLVDSLPYLEGDPRQVILPGLALTLVVVAFNFLGEAIALNRVPRPLGRRLLARRRAEAAAWDRPPRGLVTGEKA